MNTFLIFAVIALALSGAWARPRHHRSHHSQRSHRQADCSHIDYRPFGPQDVVCGSDGKTYVNEQHLRFESCLSGADVSVAKQGWCDEEIQTVETLKDLIWTLVSSSLEEMFADADPAAITALLNVFFTTKSGEDVSAEDILNFLKDADSGENISDALGDVVKVLESLDNSSEVTNDGEEEEDNGVVSVIGDGTIVIQETPAPAYAEAFINAEGIPVINEYPEAAYAEANFNPEEEENEVDSFNPEEGNGESKPNLIPDVLLD